ncbi:carbohydrate ABC transporter permease [Bogoriella caseilytica]|uniref:Putative aldouronate transport system permease protein n=1 Tax=Bogoriella caseilytica TaxID=56055 RepID=A0A3N2BDV8_9MICO|nr:carbohydrate ABC transporter permease [Bogoriella caseilytica]ROR73443.1 putative aldouronate transport system permease protein [Bogoriella caseilytica]
MNTTTAITPTVIEATSETTPAQRRRRPERRVRGMWREPFVAVSTLTVTIYALACVVPLWIIFSSSLTAERTLVRTGFSLWPTDFSLEAYQVLFSGSETLVNAYFSTLFITVVGTAGAVMATLGMAWVISRRTVMARRLMVVVYIPMVFSGGLVPLYILVTQVLQLRNTYWAVILPLLVSPFLVFVAMAFFRSIPESVLESARIDGANELRTFFAIVLPIAKPIVAVIALFYAVAYWNEWFFPLLFISDQELRPLQLLLQNMIGNLNAAQALQPTSGVQAPVYQLRMALTVVTIGPIILAYPFVQRFFVTGLTLGATKG